MDDIYRNIEEYNPETEHKILIVFKDMIGDIISDQNLNPTVTKLFIRGKKISISNKKLNVWLYWCTKKYYAQFYMLFCHKNSK